MKITVAFLGNKKNKKTNIYNKNNKSRKNSIRLEELKYMQNKERKQNKQSKLDSLLNKKRRKKELYLKNFNLEDIYSKNYIKSAKSNNDIFQNYIYIFFTIIIFCFFSKYIVNENYIFKFATNFRQAEDEKFKISELFNKYNLYNVDNYILSGEDKNIKNDNKLENENNLNENTLNKDKLKLLDIELDATKNQVEAVFAKEADVQITENAASLQRITVDKTKVLNYSSKKDIDFKALMSKDIIMTKKSDKILMYNTHTSESYSNSENYTFSYTGVKRTTDSNYNMLAIAKQFDLNLKEKGFESIQNTTPHDYGTYTNAYAKSRVTVKDALSNIGGAGISIDLHRDAAADLEYRPIVNIKGVEVAQCMFVIGTGTDTTKNDYYLDNLALALKLQKIADEVYPGLFRPMIIRNSIYNQDLNRYSLLIEVGATGNTIEETKFTTRCITNLLNILYKD